MNKISIKEINDEFGSSFDSLLVDGDSLDLGKLNFYDEDLSRHEWALTRQKLWLTDCDINVTKLNQIVSLEIDDEIIIDFTAIESVDQSRNKFSIFKKRRLV
jgi:hypothetical protein